MSIEGKTLNQVVLIWNIIFMKIKTKMEFVAYLRMH